VRKIEFQFQSSRVGLALNLCRTTWDRDLYGDGAVLDLEVDSGRCFRFRFGLATK